MKRQIDWCIIGTLLVYVGIILFSYTYKMNPYFWYDESGQFWMAKGLNHYSEPNASFGGVSDIVENNTKYNMDPGGFSILLHFWAMISNGYIWLRTLPLLFFFAAVACFIYVAYRWSKNITLSLLMGFLPIVFPITNAMSLELRAYSMELLGCVLSVIMLERLKTEVTIKRLLVWSCIMAVFMTSRYSFVIVVFIASLYVLYLIYMQHISWQQKCKMVLVYALPVLLSLFYVYFFAMRLQNPTAKPAEHLLSFYLSENPKRLFWKENIPYLVYLSLFTFFYCIKNYCALLKKYSVVLYMVVVVNWFFILLSLLGKHPWDPHTNRCISMLTMTLIGTAAIIMEASDALEKYISPKYYLLGLCTFLFLTDFRTTEALHPRQDLGAQLQKIDIKQYSQIYVDIIADPDVRYMYEIGVLKNGNEDSYPKNFRFSKPSPLYKDYHDNLKPEYGDVKDYDMLIVSDMFQPKFDMSLYFIAISKNIWVKKQ